MPAPVIVVHDEDDVRQSTVDALLAAGHECVGFVDPMTALDAIEDNTRVRVLVTRVDFGEGKLSGLALSRMLLVKRAGISTVFIARPEYERLAEGVGVFLPIIPFDPQSLIEMVKVVERLVAKQR
jgi:FixJ family two-component response regulator